MKTYLFSGDREGRVKPLLECVAGLEDGGKEEVEEGPELGQLVLQRGARQQQTVRGAVERVDRGCQLVVVVLHSVALVNDHVLPPQLGQDSLVLD